MCPRISWELVADPWNHWDNVSTCCPILGHRKLIKCVPRNKTPGQRRYAGCKATKVTHSSACLASPSRNIATYLRHCFFFFFIYTYQTCYSFFSPSSLYVPPPPPPPLPPVTLSPLPLLYYYYYVGSMWSPISTPIWRAV
jgi:hypothetical protein